jgi:hypothetical protein
MFHLNLIHMLSQLKSSTFGSAERGGFLRRVLQTCDTTSLFISRARNALLLALSLSALGCALPPGTYASRNRGYNPVTDFPPPLKREKPRAKKIATPQRPKIVVKVSSVSASAPDPNEMARLRVSLQETMSHLERAEARRATLGAEIAGSREGFGPFPEASHQSPVASSMAALGPAHPEPVADKDGLPEFSGIRPGDRRLALVHLDELIAELRRSVVSAQARLEEYDSGETERRYYEREIVRLAAEGARLKLEREKLEAEQAAVKIEKRLMVKVGGLENRLGLLRGMLREEQSRGEELRDDASMFRDAFLRVDSELQDAKAELARLQLERSGAVARESW